MKGIEIIDNSVLINDNFIDYHFLNNYNIIRDDIICRSKEIDIYNEENIKKYPLLNVEVSDIKDIFNKTNHKYKFVFMKDGVCYFNLDFFDGFHINIRSEISIHLPNRGNIHRVLIAYKQLYLLIFVNIIEEMEKSNIDYNITLVGKDNNFLVRETGHYQLCMFYNFIKQPMRKLVKKYYKDKNRNKYGLNHPEIDFLDFSILTLNNYTHVSKKVEYLFDIYKISNIDEYMTNNIAIDKFFDEILEDLKKRLDLNLLDFEKVYEEYKLGSILFNNSKLIAHQKVHSWDVRDAYDRTIVKGLLLLIEYYEKNRNQKVVDRIYEILGNDRIWESLSIDINNIIHKKNLKKVEKFRTINKMRDL
ncbi:hypothetical protein Bp8pS_089 [Bacillus phage vB_BpuM-BpSp]|nr:hypothetical protein Bp8pS_089 [Bacillus phage vB_BpuM-BpSp]